MNWGESLKLQIYKHSNDIILGAPRDYRGAKWLTFGMNEITIATTATECLIYETESEK